MKKRTIIISGFFLATSLFLSAAEKKNRLLELRNETAKSCFKPTPYLKLAKYHFERGNKIQAFYICEYYRRAFGDKQFDKVFPKTARIKLDASPQFKTEEEMKKYALTHPDSYESFLNKWEKKIGKQELTPKQNQQFLKEAFAKFPNKLEPTAYAAQYYFKALKDWKKALPLYLSLYFNDPHFYDGEFAESRIREISRKYKAEWYKTRRKQYPNPEQFVLHEKNPRVLDLFIKEVREKWDPSMIPALFLLFLNDDPTVQANVLHLLMDHPKACLSQKEKIKSLLKSDDYVIRAMAGCLVAKCFPPSDYDLLKEGLNSGVDLIQLDIIQTFLYMGGKDGKKFLKANPPKNASKEIMAYILVLILKG